MRKLHTLIRGVLPRQNSQAIRRSRIAGYIAEVMDEATGITDEVLTKGNLITIRGWGLKIDGETANQNEIGLYFVPVAGGGQSLKAEIIAVNEPRTIKAIVPTGFNSTYPHRIKIVTQTSAKTGGHLLKNIRELWSEGAFTV